MITQGVFITLSISLSFSSSMIFITEGANSVDGTPNDLAKIGMAGIIKPKPNATKKETAVITVTSRGKSINGELNRLIA